MEPPETNSIVRSVSLGVLAQYPLVIHFNVFHATRLAWRYVGATYHALRPGPQAARINSVNARYVFPKRRPATRTRKRSSHRKTIPCGGFNRIIMPPPSRSRPQSQELRKARSQD